MDIELSIRTGRGESAFVCRAGSMCGPTTDDSRPVENVDAKLRDMRSPYAPLSETARPFGSVVHGDAMRHSVTGSKE